jgi:hypothetical protein
MTKTTANIVGQIAMTIMTIVKGATTGGEIAHRLLTEKTTGKGTETVTGIGRGIGTKRGAEMMSIRAIIGLSQIEIQEGRLLCNNCFSICLGLLLCLFQIS